MTQKQIDEFKAFLAAGMPEETLRAWAQAAVKPAASTNTP
jgi:hypothetical protein